MSNTNTTPPPADGAAPRLIVRGLFSIQRQLNALFNQVSHMWKQQESIALQAANLEHRVAQLEAARDVSRREEPATVPASSPAPTPLRAVRIGKLVLLVPADQVIAETQPPPTSDPEPWPGGELLP